MKKRVGAFWTPLRILLTVIFALVLSGIATWIYLQDKDVPIFDPKGSVGAQERDLLVFTLWLSLIVIVPVYTMLVAFAWRYREGNKHKAAYTPDVDTNHWLEAVWWGIPIVIICILGTVTWITTHKLDPHRQLDSDVPALRVQVVALQWKWLFIYPEQQIATVNQLKIPTGTPINFEITADAPMSAFWIPSLGTQTYAMNGMTSRLSLISDHPGMYRGTNTNINGKGYSRMDFEVVSMNTRRDFDIWAKTVVDTPDRKHMDWTAYSKLAEPSESHKPTYYQLRDGRLYDKIIHKYMPQGHNDTTGRDHKERGAH